MTALNGQEVNGLALTVTEARSREERGSGKRGFTGRRDRGGLGGGRRY